MVLGIVLIVFGVIYQINPNLFRRWFWKRTSIAQRLLSPPAYEKYMRGLGFLYIIIGLCICAMSPHSQETMLMIPHDQLPKSHQEQTSQAELLLAQYPEDPRSHLFYAERFADAHDFAKAEEEIRTAIRLTDEHRDLIKNYAASRNAAQIALALDLQASGKTAEARTEAAGPCSATASDQPDERLYAILTKLKLCEKATSRDTCENTMTNYATKMGADPKTYIAQNQDYLSKCIQQLQPR